MTGQLEPSPVGREGDRHVRDGLYRVAPAGGEQKIDGGRAV